MKLITVTLCLISFAYALPTNNRVIDGEDTDITEIPYQVSLQFAGGSSSFCGGSIIGPKYVLTAGHCFESDENPSDRVVVVGVTKLSEGGTIHTIKRSIRSSDYGSVHQFSHDICILELNEPIEFNERAQPIHLPDPDEIVPINTACRVGGWGLLSPGGSSPDHLQSTIMPIWDPRQCLSKWTDMDASHFIGDEASMVCAGWQGARPNVCNGDSGGPLVCNGTQFGIVSFGRGCANPDYPTIFSHVYNLRQFVKDVAGI